MKKKRKESEYQKLVKSGMSYKQASEVLKRRKAEATQKRVDTAVKEVSGLAPSRNIIFRGSRDFNIERGRTTALERGMLVTEFIATPFWIKYLKPKIEQDISDSIRKGWNAVDAKTRDEAAGAGNYGNRLLATISKWQMDMIAATRLIEEEKKKKNASKV